MARWRWTSLVALWSVIAVDGGPAVADGKSAPWGVYTFTSGWTYMEKESTCASGPPGDVTVRVTEDRSVRASGIPGRLVKIPDDGSGGIAAVFRTKPVRGTYRNTMVGVWLAPDGEAHAVVAIGRFGPDGNELCTDGWKAVGRFDRR